MMPLSGLDWFLLVSIALLVGTVLYHRIEVSGLRGDLADITSTKEWLAAKLEATKSESAGWQGAYNRVMHKLTAPRTVPQMAAAAVRPVSYLVVDYNGQTVRVRCRETAEKFVEFIRMAYLVETRLECPPVDILEVAGGETAIEHLFGVARG